MVSTIRQIISRSASNSEIEDRFQAIGMVMRIMVIQLASLLFTPLIAYCLEAPVITISCELADDSVEVTLNWPVVVGADQYDVYSSEQCYGEGQLIASHDQPPFTARYGTTVKLSFYVIARATEAFPGFTYVPAGSFWMGSLIGECVEQPVHQVTLTSDYYLGSQQVTNEEYRSALQWAYDSGYVTVSSSSVLAYGVVLLTLASDACEITFSEGVFGLRESPHNHAQIAYPDGYDPAVHPVKEVTWYGAACYCDWLSEMEGLEPFYNGIWDQTLEHNPYEAEGYRLPTEAEWEYAAKYCDDRNYPWGGEYPDCDFVNFEPDDYCIGWTTPVCSYPEGVSELGLFDMAGNSVNWCGDWYGAYSAEAQIDPLGADSGIYRVLRGGGWYDPASNQRCAFRYWDSPHPFFHFASFRICRTANP